MHQICKSGYSKTLFDRDGGRCYALVILEHISEIPFLSLL